MNSESKSLFFFFECLHKDGATGHFNIKVKNAAVALYSKTDQHLFISCFIPYTIMLYYNMKNIKPYGYGLYLMVKRKKKESNQFTTTA